jgi:hypothetical protein
MPNIYDNIPLPSVPTPPAPPSNDDGPMLLWGCGGVFFGGLTFLGCWIYCAATYGFLFGFGLGWLPALICGFLVGIFWPLIAAVLLYFYLQSR